jgi:hypothetical protein
MYMDVYIDFGDKKEIRSKDGDVIEISDGCSPMFPEAHEIYQKIIAFAQDGKHEGGQIDWGSWYANLTKKEMLGLYNGVDLRNIIPHYAHALPFIKKLPDDGVYKVVTSEG